MSAGFYDRWDYLEEKRDALERWSRELQRIVTARARLRLVERTLSQRHPFGLLGLRARRLIVRGAGPGCVSTRAASPQLFCDQDFSTAGLPRPYLVAGRCRGGGARAAVRFAACETRARSAAFLGLQTGTRRWPAVRVPEPFCKNCGEPGRTTAG